MNEQNGPNRQNDQNDPNEQIEGRNPVLEALRAGHEINKIYVLKGEATGSLKSILDLAARKRIPVNFLELQVLDKMATTRNHQGVIAQAASWKYASVDLILEQAVKKGEPPFVVILDGVEDPQNLGSIIRTAEAAGVHGIIIPERRAAGLSVAVSRASAGAIEYMPVARVTNLTRTIEDLKKVGLWFSAAEMTGKVEFEQADLKGPIGLVIGGEGNGISRLVLEHCDQSIRLPMWGQVNSLNVAVATGIALYEIRRQRSLAVK
jgi:23S rRNA (guanosine2251-2'-O)-methyltransferase